MRPLLDELPELQTVILIDALEDESGKIRSLSLLMTQASDLFEIVPIDPEDMSILHFTSGTTEMPKGVVHVHKAIYLHWMSGKYVLDMHPDDIYWCTADPGWVIRSQVGLAGKVWFLLQPAQHERHIPTLCTIINVVLKFSARAIEGSIVCDLWSREWIRYGTKGTGRFFYGRISYVVYLLAKMRLDHLYPLLDTLFGQIVLVVLIKCKADKSAIFDRFRIFIVIPLCRPSVPYNIGTTL